MKYSFTFIMTLFFAVGAAFGQNRQTQTHDVITINLDQKFESKPILLSQLVDSVEIVPLESNVDSYIPRLKDIFISTNFIALTSGSDYPNFASVKLFSRKGDFIRSIGKRGGGPGEYVNPAQMMKTFPVNGCQGDFVRKHLRTLCSGNLVMILSTI